MFSSTPPYRFNPWKHHLQWVLQYILNNPKDLRLRVEVIANIKSINSNHVDIYIGHLTPGQIIQAIDDELKKLEIVNRNRFSSWLSHHEFQMITLSDKSVWILREGMEDGFYIHLHPARNSTNAIRIHGNSWKTAIVTKILYPYLTDIDIHFINEVREKQLNLSPIKELDDCQRLLKAMKLLKIIADPIL